MFNRDLLLPIALALLIGALMSIGTILGIYTDWAWFSAIGYLSVFKEILLIRILLFVFFTGVTFAFFYFNINYALKASPDQSRARDYRSIVVLVVAFFSILMGLSFSGQWKTVLLYLNQVGFGISDPVFGLDVGFYVFDLPLYHFIKNVALILTLLAIVAVATIYVLSIAQVEAEYVESFFDLLPREGIKHLSVLAGLFFILLAVHFYLARYGILYSASGAVYGAGYTDVNVVLPALLILAVVSVFAAISFLLGTYRSIVLVVFLIALFGGTVVAPALVQSFKVAPNELSLEEPYIENNIRMTRHAYDIHDVKEKTFPITKNLTAEKIQDNPGTVNNIRLWDHRALKPTFKQLQEIRTYYTFNDVDVDRYDLEERGYTQVMLSPREMDTNRLPSRAQTWENEHLRYTHGYGVVMSPVSFQTPDGLPQLIEKDIPPTGVLNITRPEVYYGEVSQDYVVVNTERKEFDYPVGEDNKYTTYDGTGGVKLDGARKAAFAFRFGSMQLFLSDYITPDSRLQMHRQIVDRVETIAPFLELDSDPYMVVHDGRLYWILDAYTTTDDYPYSEPVYRGNNYMRNSVKVVVDAYDGDVNYYVVDEDDPLIQAWQKIFPGLFHSFDEMPDGLKQHVRYPEDFFKVQTSMYKKYHMTDPSVFYNQEDMWEVPMETYEGRRIPVDPYYVMISLPENNQAEFILMQPFTPSNKDNLIAWVGARSDPPNYGELIHYKFPKGELVFGPSQIEARIDQDAEISQQLTLWDQRGSRVIRGNLLVIPVNDSILYVEPVYITSEERGLPELRRVIVSDGEQVVMHEKLGDSLDALFGKVEEKPPEPTGAPETIQELVESAIEHYDSAMNSVGVGDWSTFGDELDRLGEILRKMNQTVTR